MRVTLDELRDYLSIIICSQQMGVYTFNDYAMIYNLHEVLKKQMETSDYVLSPDTMNDLYKVFSTVIIPRHNKLVKLWENLHKTVQRKTRRKINRRKPHRRL